MIAIFVFSSDLFSSPQTGSVVEVLLRWLFPFLRPEQVAAIHIGIRKGAHIGVYAALSYFYAVGLASDIKPIRNWRPSWGVLCFILTVFYACTDEWHQSFSIQRTGTVKDVAWDALGSALAQVVIFTNWKRSKR